MQFGLKLFLPEVMTCLELDNCNLFDLDILPARWVSWTDKKKGNEIYWYLNKNTISLTNLRWISLRSNSLKNVDRLAMFKSLEEICVEGNEIDEVEQLCNLPALLRLDANDNLISGIHSASEFKSLIFLSLDRNRVKSLKSFSTCKTLMELCK